MFDLDSCPAQCPDPGGLIHWGEGHSTGAFVLLFNLGSPVGQLPQRLEEGYRPFNQLRPVWSSGQAKIQEALLGQTAHFRRGLDFLPFIPPGRKPYGLEAGKAEIQTTQIHEVVPAP